MATPRVPTPATGLPAELRSAATVLERCRNIAAAVAAGESPHFALERGRLDALADRVARVTRERHPDGRVPLHSVWRRFDAGGAARAARLDQRLASRTSVGAARARIELALLAVVLGGAAGPAWRYTEPGSRSRFVRCDGLALATFDAFVDGRFSSDGGDPCRVDAKALLRIDAAALAQVFQVDADNPLPALDGRAALLHRLARALRERPELFTADGLPGHLFDALTHHRHAHHLPHANLHHPSAAAFRHRLAAPRVLEWLLDVLGPLGGARGEPTPFGDVWRHPHAGGDGASAGWVPLHEPMQRVVQSLVEPFERAGVHVDQLDALTGLADERSAGLLLDAGIVVPRDAGFATRRHAAADPWVIEWRALTVALLDELASRVRERLDADAAALPLARLHEGGIRPAALTIAVERRGAAAPPVQLDADSR